MTPKNYVKIAEKYINDVQSGIRKAGKLEKKAVKRHLSDLENAAEKQIYFEERSAQKAFAFFQLLKHSKGEFSGDDFILSPWQAFIVYALFGWKRANGSRRFRYAYIEVARKNGKTTFAAALALLMLIFDGESGAEIYTAATKHEQAKICWGEAKNMISKSTALKKYVDAYQNTLVMESTLSKMQPLSSDSGTQDGLNPHFAVCDEMHAWKTEDLYGVLKSATGSRRQPLIFIITTAGLNKNYPCYSLRNTLIDVLDGIKQQDNTFVMIFTLDEGDDWKDPQNWEKANPNLGISVDAEYLNEEFRSAINRGGREEVNFKTKNLNMWVDSAKTWIPDERVIACEHGVTDQMLIGQTCYAGLDLASHVDINALALYFPNIDKKPVVKMFFWIPESKVAEQEDIVDYRLWISQGFVRTTPGNVIDIDFIVADIDAILKKYNCENLAFDPAKAYHGVIQGLDKAGHSRILDEFSQNIRSVSEPTKKLESLIHSGDIDLLKNPVLRWMFRNAVAYTDANENIRLDKAKSQNKIDGLAAIINALGGFMSSGRTKIPYQNHELRVIPR